MTAAGLATETLTDSADWLPQLVSMRLMLPVVTLSLFWMWETLHPFIEHQSDRAGHAVRNLALAVGNAAVIGLLFGTVTVLTAHWTVENRSGLLQMTDRFPVGRFLAGLILLDAWLYVWHRLNHQVPVLWRFHRTHHSDPHMDVTTATRFHLGEYVISAGLRLLLIPLLGLSLWQIIVYEMAVAVTTHFHHANISLGRADRWLRCLFVTPDLHRVHHSRWKPETDSNYAVVLSVWDRLARSFRLNPHPQSIVFGLDDFADGQWQTIPGMLKTPFVTRPGREDSEPSDDSETISQPQVPPA